MSTEPYQWVPESRRPLIQAYAEELRDWNARVNLVSRASVERIPSHHIPHCLTLASRSFPSESTVVDWGTGGGLPAIPLAIAFPEVRFIGVDSTGKKTAAVAGMARDLGLDNVEAWHGRAEAWHGRADYAVSRATAPLARLWQWTRRILLPGTGVLPTERRGATFWRTGLICLKGGDLRSEIGALPPGADLERISLSNLIREDGAWTDKYILHVTAGHPRSR